MADKRPRLAPLKVAQSNGGRVRARDLSWRREGEAGVPRSSALASRPSSGGTVLKGGVVSKPEKKGSVCSSSGM